VAPAWDRVKVATDVLLLRHAPTDWNDHGRRLGWADQPLTAEGRRAAEAWTGGSGVEFAAVVASDLKRARETAQIIADGLGLSPVVELVGLREQDQGAWTGLTKDQIKRQWPDRLRERPRRPVRGESPEVVLERVLVTLDRVAGAHEGRRVLAITHGGVIHALERAIGADAPGVPHLEGRWLHVVAPHRPRGGSAAGSVHAGELTVGRRPRAAGESAHLVAARRL
jgi:broad specificity phosphatase PhoE